MGALTARAHGPIAAMAALATASASGDLPEKSSVRGLCARVADSRSQSMSFPATANASIRVYKPFPYPAWTTSLPSFLSSSSFFPPSRSRLSAFQSPGSATMEGSVPVLFSNLPPSSPLRIHGSLSDFASPFRTCNLPKLDLSLRSFDSVNLNLSRFVNGSRSLFPLSVPVEFLHAWHSPFGPSKKSTYVQGQGQENTVTAVVLLGWLGAQQKHLKKYAEWYASRGIHAITFIIPMSDLLTLKPGSKAEKHIDTLAHELMRWLKNEAKEGSNAVSKKYVIFHTFSNTGWLTYGAILEWLLQHDDNLIGNIKGCVVDSAPAAKPDPEVWASGFVAALLKKRKTAVYDLTKVEADAAEKQLKHFEPNLTEAAIHAMLEKFFSIFLKVPYVNRRLSDITTILTQQQPACPQLYIYSTADDVIPVQLIESFINQQKKSGQTVMACNFEHSPHVDHFRTFPDLYGDQLNRFLKHCLHGQRCE